jgi:hypothetical protein
MIYGHGRTFARLGWQVVAVVHLVNVDHLLATTHPRLIANAWHITIATPTLVRIVVEWRAVATVTILKTKKLNTADVRAELVA